MTRPVTSSTIPAVAETLFPELQQRHIQMLSQIANELAEPADVFRMALELSETIGSTSFTRERVIRLLSEFLLTVSEADVAYVRERENSEIMALVQKEVWAAGVTPTGVPAKKKYIEDGPCPDQIDNIGGGGGDKPALARSRGNHYSKDELDFMEWLGSEAWIPIKDQGVTKAVIFLGKGDRDFFTPERIKTLSSYQSFAQTFYNMASLADLQIENIELMKRVAAVLPMMANAKTPEGFWRAICTLLTCHHGFRFDRALLFWMHNHQLPATCMMAVGGLGDRSYEWVKQREELHYLFRSLREYIQDSLDHPVPGGHGSKASLIDPLYQRTTDDPILFTEGDTGKIRELVARGRDEGGGAIKLTDRDPWIAQMQRKRPGIFASKNGEYFVFPLRPLDSKEEPTLLGFVIADLAYREEQFLPGPGNPNLGVIGVVLNLLSALWLAREKEETYLQALVALPDLRHGAAALDTTLSLLVEELKNQRWDRAKVKSLVDDLVPAAEKVRVAGDFAEQLRRRRFTESVSDLGGFLQQFKKDVTRRYPQLLACTLEPDGYNEGVRIHPFFLKSTLLCLFDNAVSASNPNGVSVTINPRLIHVPEGEKTRPRVLIEVSNDGPPIPTAGDLEHLLFVNRVSNHRVRLKHRGSGLSSARLQVQSYGGDLVLLSPDPVRFGIVLDPETRAGSAP